MGDRKILQDVQEKNLYWLPQQCRTVTGELCDLTARKLRKKAKQIEEQSTSLPRQFACVHPFALNKEIMPKNIYVSILVLVTHNAQGRNSNVGVILKLTYRPGTNWCWKLTFIYSKRQILLAIAKSNECMFTITDVPWGLPRCSSLYMSELWEESGPGLAE